MSKLRKTLISTTAGLVTLGVAASVALAQGGMMGQGQGMGPGVMGPGMQQTPGQGMGPGMMGPGMQQMPGQGMGPGMMGPGMQQMPGQGMGPGMMGPGMQQMPGTPGQGMGPGMMGPGMQQMPGTPGQGIGPGMMGPGMQQMPGVMGQGPGVRVTPSQHLTTEDVSHFLDHFLERHENPRLKVGKVEQVDEDTIMAEIVTVDDSLVQRFTVDRHTGQMVPDSAGQAQPPN